MAEIQLSESNLENKKQKWPVLTRKMMLKTECQYTGITYTPYIKETYTRLWIYKFSDDLLLNVIKRV